MKNAVKKALSIMLVAVMLFGAAPLNGFVGLELPDWLDISKLFLVEAEAATYNGTCGANLTWTLDTDTSVLEITGTGAMADYPGPMLVPWRSHSDYIKTVKIADGVTGVGKCAFMNCERITSVTIPESVTSIGEGAFYCYNLTSAYYPGTPQQWKNVTVGTSNDDFVGHLVYECNSSNPYYGGACGDNLTWKLYTSTGELEISGSGDMYDYDYESKGPWRFLQDIKTVEIGNGVTSIGDNAFGWCISITSITIPDGVTSIGRYAFEDCYHLTSLMIPESVTNIGNDLFGGSCELRNAYYPSTPEQWENVTVGKNNSNLMYNLIFECNSEKPYYGGIFGDDLIWKLYINTDELEIIGIGSMSDLSVPGSAWDAHDSKIKSVVISNGVTDICDLAFADCNSLTNITIPDSVTSIGDYAFLRCLALESVSIPDKPIYISRTAFAECYNTSIKCKSGSYAYDFAVRNNISVIVADDSAGTAFKIENRVLSDYSGTASNVVLPSDISAVGYRAFEENATVKSVEIPYCVSEIYGKAFENCSKLERVIIPFTVTDISASAFTGTNAIIYCYYNSYAYNYAVANGIPYELVTVTLSTNSINIVETQSVSVDAVPSITLASGIPLVWKSNNPAVASVDSTGKIVGNGVGTTMVGVYDINGNMLDECAVNVGEKIEVEFEEPSTDTLNYGEKLVLHINTANLPDGASVKWTTSDGNNLKISNENAACDKHSNCVTCTVESVGNGSAEITGTVVDKNGKPIIQDGKEIEVSYKMNSKAGFFQKIIAFFKKLFGLLKTYQQSL